MSIAILENTAQDYHSLGPELNCCILSLFREEQINQWQKVREHEAENVLEDRNVEENASENPAGEHKDSKHFHTARVINYESEERLPNA